MDQGSQFLQIAKAEDNAQNLEAAYHAYKMGIKELLLAHKLMVGDQQKKELKSTIEKNMTRAEQIKSQLGLPPRKQTYEAKIDPTLRRLLEAEMMTPDSSISFNDISGLEDVKQTLREMVIFPALRPDLFSGIRQPPRGLLLFGPPGNGKTFIARAVAAEAKSTFFNISASSLMSKNFGEGEKLMRGLFALAREKAPSIIFVDEIDSILSRRSSEEHEASRRMKTEFLVQFDGADPSCRQQHVVLIGATNVPEDLDEAVIRRLAKRLYVPMPDTETRNKLVLQLLQGQTTTMSNTDYRWLMKATENYSCSDIRALVQEAAMGPLRDLGNNVATVQAHKIGPIKASHFSAALERIRPSVSRARLKSYEQWNNQQQ